MKNHREFGNVWNLWGNSTFEDVILAKATKLKNVKKKADKLNAVEELINYSKRYLNRLITGK